MFIENKLFELLKPLVTEVAFNDEVVAEAERIIERKDKDLYGEDLDNMAGYEVYCQDVSELIKKAMILVIIKMITSEVSLNN